MGVPSMSLVLKSIRALSDATRLRIIALLEKDELSVQELQEITRTGQSRISTHLGLLLESGLVQSRREGKRAFYSLNPEAKGTANGVMKLAVEGARELPEYAADRINLKRVLKRRREQAQIYFNQVAGRFDRVYGPGRSWQGFGHLLLRILPPLVVADLGSGEGLIGELLARRCKKVIAVDNSEKDRGLWGGKGKKERREKSRVPARRPAEPADRSRQRGSGDSQSGLAPCGGSGLCNIGGTPSAASTRADPHSGPAEAQL